MPVRSEFVIDLKGRKFVMFAGLLELAHEMGLRSIETEVIAELSDPKEQFWVVRAIARFKNPDGEDSVWSAYGDASPNSSQMRGAYLRHAETRSMARVLRVSTNVGITAFEELGPDVNDEQPGAAANGAARRPLVRHEGTADPTRADRRQNAPVPANTSGYVAAGDSVCEIDGCNTVLTKNQLTLSQHKAGGMILCPSHLKEIQQPAGK
jgi:hypothetical protein